MRISGWGKNEREREVKCRRSCARNRFDDSASYINPCTDRNINWKFTKSPRHTKKAPTVSYRAVDFVFGWITRTTNTCISEIMNSLLTMRQAGECLIRSSTECRTRGSMHLSRHVSDIDIRSGLAILSQLVALAFCEPSIEMEFPANEKAVGNSINSSRKKCVQSKKKRSEIPRLQSTRLPHAHTHPHASAQLFVFPWSRSRGAINTW